MVGENETAMINFDQQTKNNHNFMCTLKFTTANLLETANKNKIQDCTGPIINLYTPYHIEILAKFRSCELYFGPVVFRLK